MGAVYEAEDTLLGRRVAVKVVPRPGQGGDPLLDRLLREAKAAAQLSHPNVVTVHHVGRWPGGYYLVLELVRGGSLQDRIASGTPLPWMEATCAVADACLGVHAAHAAGFIHRDLKPSNLLCDESGRVKVADFGLVCGGDLTTSTPGRLVGTPYYMSPEQCRSEPADERSDVYALGATYFVLLTGQTPYPAGSPMLVMFAHCSAPPPDPRAVVPSLPPGCSAIVQRAMAKAPADRYQSAAEFRTALRGLLTPSHKSQPSPPTSRTAAFRSPWHVRGVALVLGLLVIAIASLTLFWPNLASDHRPTDHIPEESSDQASSADRIAPTELFSGRPIRLAGPVHALAFAPDGSRLAAGALGNHQVEYPDGAVVWEVATGQVVAHLWPGQEIRCLVFKNDGDVLTMGGRDGALDWHFPTQQEFPCLEAGYGGIAALAVTLDGRLQAAGFADGICRGQIDEWRMPDGNNVRKFGQYQGWAGVRQLAYHADGTLAAAFADGAVRVWYPDELDPVPEWQQSLTREPSLIAFTPADRPKLAVVAGSEVSFWERDGSSVSWVLRSSFRIGTVNAITVTGDGKYLVTGGPGRTIVFWEIVTGDRICTLPGHHATVLSVALSPDGTVLASGDESGTVRLWNVRQELARSELD